MSKRPRGFMLDHDFRERTLRLMSNVEYSPGNMSAPGCKWKADHKCQVDN